MSNPIKISKVTVARARVAASRGSMDLPSTGIDIEPVEEARKLQALNCFIMVVSAILLFLINLAIGFHDGGGMLILSLIISVVAFFLAYFFSRIALARSIAALMTWHYTERTAAAAFAQRHTLQAILEKLGEK